MASTQLIIQLVIIIICHGAYVTDSTYVTAPVSANSIGIIDILDDIHLQFDFIVTTSYPNIYSNIVHIGSQSYILLLSLSVSFHRSNQSHCVFECKPIPLNTWHHFQFHFTQDNVVALLNGEHIYNKTSHSSHPILSKQPVYINNNPRHTQYTTLTAPTSNS
eukprot:960993_1